MWILAQQRYNTHVLTKWTSWVRFVRHNQVEYAPHQIGVHYAEEVLLGFRKWLPQALISERNFYRRPIPFERVAIYMTHRYPFIKSFFEPCRFSLMVPRRSGYKEKIAVLPRNAQEREEILRKLRGFLPTCPSLMSHTSDIDN
jgi:hypothetical protein